MKGEGEGERTHPPTRGCCFFLVVGWGGKGGVAGWQKVGLLGVGGRQVGRGKAQVQHRQGLAWQVVVVVGLCMLVEEVLCLCRQGAGMFCVSCKMAGTRHVYRHVHVCMFEREAK